MLAQPASPPAIIAEVRVPKTVSGVVVDAETGRPVAGVYVQQVGGIAATFTGMDGSFRLALAGDGGDRLAFTAPNFQRIEQPLGNGQGLRVRLRALAAYIPPLPPKGPGTPLVRAVLDTGIGFGYRLRQQQVLDQGGRIGALADNDLAFSGRLRLDRWLIQADGSHVQVPIDVAGLPADQNPAFSPSTYRAGASVDHVFPHGPQLELAVGPAYRFENTKPYNNDVRYIGNRFDFEQTRHALGIEGAVGWRRRSWVVSGTLGAYPLVFAWAGAPGSPYANQFGARASIGGDYEVIPDLHLGLSYRYEGWHGNGNDASSLFALQVFYALPFKREVRP
jgi:hypothetical protein